MSKEEIVRTWKNDGRRQPEPDAPANPAGDVSLSDTDLDKVAGGDDMPTLDLRLRTDGLRRHLPDRHRTLCLSRISARSSMAT